MPSGAIKISTKEARLEWQRDKPRRLREIAARKKKQAERQENFLPKLKGNVARKIKRLEMRGKKPQKVQEIEATENEANLPPFRFKKKFKNITADVMW